MDVDGYEEGKRESAKLTTPSPGDQTGKDSPQNWSNTTSQSPNPFSKPYTNNQSKRPKQNNSFKQPTKNSKKDLPINKLLSLKLNKSLIQTCTSKINPPPAAP